MDLVLIHPGGQSKIYQSLSRNLSALEPPLWAAMLAGFTRQHGFSVSILDPQAEGWTADETAERAIRKNSKLIAVVVYGHQPSASTQHMPAVREICQAVKSLNPNQKIILVGGHVAALPQKTLEEEPVDFVCSGEGPYTLAGLLEVLKSFPSPLSSPQEGRGNGSNFPSPLGRGVGEGVPDLWYRDNDQIRFTFPAPLIKDLDQEFADIAWDLLPMEKYRAHNWHCFGGILREPYASIYTTLGCPYHCSFCCIQAPFKSGEKASEFSPSVNSYRFWSPEKTLSQIDTLVQKYGVRNIKIADEMFVLNARHVRAICQGLIERNYDLNLWAYARIDTVTPDLLEPLRKAGFRWLAIGIESANESVRTGVEKPFAQATIFATMKKIRETGIHVISNYIFGLPDDTIETMQETLDLACELNTEFANFYCTMAYPGSSLYMEALREKWPLPGNWLGYSQHSVSTFPLPTKYLSSDEVVRFRDRAFRIYFDRPEYLSMMEQTFGAASRREIIEMLSYRLERQNAH